MIRFNIIAESLENGVREAGTSDDYVGAIY